MSPDCPSEDLLVPVFRRGEAVYAMPSLEDVRKYAQSQLSQLHPSIKRFVNAHRYPAGLERRLHEFRSDLSSRAKR